MAVERRTDSNEAGERLAAHGLAGPLLIELEGSEAIVAIVATRTDRPDPFVWVLI